MQAPSNPTTGSPDLGGAPTGPVCVWVPLSQANAGNFFPRNVPDGQRPDGADISDLLIQQCDGEFTYVVQWPSPGGPAAPGAAGPAVQTVLISPIDVARQVLAEVDIPKPQAMMDVGIATQLEANLWVGDRPMTNEGSFAGLTAEVTLRPVDQSWEIRGVPGGAPPVECDSAQPPEQRCTWTPNHSSATVDPAVGGERDGAPCFPATVTVTWEATYVVTADGEVVDQGVFDPPPPPSENPNVCLVVGEIQALNG